MMNKITILFPFLLFCVSALANMGYVQTHSAIHIYQDRTDKPVLSLPLTEPFLVAHVANQAVIDKLGSFKMGDKITKQTFNEISELNITQTNNQITLSGNISNAKESHKFSLIFESVKTDIFFLLNIDNKHISNIHLKFLSNHIEHIYGMGEQFSYVDVKGKKIPMLVEENGIGRGDPTSTQLANILGAAGNTTTTYAPIPFFLTSEHRGLMVLQHGRMDFDFSSDEFISLDVWDNSIEGLFFTGESPKEILTKYTAVTGRMPELPSWIYGAVLGLQGGKEKVDSIINLSLENKVPVSAIWIQDWVGKRQTAIGSRLQWDWQVNETVYPNFKAWVDSLHQINIKVLAYINPYFVEGGQTCKTALEKGYTVMDSDGQPYKFAAGGFSAYMVDFTNPDAREWYKSIIRNNMLALGIDGWMADFGEWVPFDATFFDPVVKAEDYHNQYPVEWMRLNSDVLKEEGRNDVFVFNRSGHLFSNSYALAFWTGDQMANYGTHDGLPSAINALVSSGMSGITVNHTDIGGYTAIKFLGWEFYRERDLLFRWMEMAAFTPVFRTHEGLRPEKMTQFYTDKATLSFFAEMAQLQLSLKPLFVKYGKEATDKGWPIIRHPYLEFPEDPNTYDLQYQFMLGDSLMVVPVIEADSKTAKGYLPEGNWEHYFTGKQFMGGNHYIIDVPYGQPAVFKKLD